MSVQCGAGCSNYVSEGINCEICNVIFHPKCAGMTLAAVRVVKLLSYFNWFCNTCGAKYADAAKKAVTSEAKLPDQLSDIRDLVVKCSVQLEEVKIAVVKQVNVSHIPPKKSKPIDMVNFDRRKNLIIARTMHNFSLIGTDNPEKDAVLLENICDELEVEMDPDVKCYRLKKSNPESSHPPLIRVEFSNLNIRSAFLKKAKNLSKSSDPSYFGPMYVRPDLSFSQIESNKIAIAEPKERRFRGEHVIIRHDFNLKIYLSEEITNSSEDLSHESKVLVSKECEGIAIQNGCNSCRFRVGRLVTGLDAFIPIGVSGFAGRDARSLTIDQLKDRFGNEFSGQSMVKRNGNEQKKAVNERQTIKDAKKMSNGKWIITIIATAIGSIAMIGIVTMGCKLINEDNYCDKVVTDLNDQLEIKDSNETELAYKHEDNSNEKNKLNR